MLIIAAGPMFAGKTTWLIDHANKLAPNTFEIFKPNIDTRYADDACVTHDGVQIKAKNLDIKNPVFPKLNKTTKTVFIDELNFFDPKLLLPQIQTLLKKGVQVIGVGLMHDFRKQFFGATEPLSKLADEFTQLFARCDRCKGKANHSYRKTKQHSQVVLGAEESYGACCEKCWEKLNEETRF